VVGAKERADEEPGNALNDVDEKGSRVQVTRTARHYAAVVPARAAAAIAMAMSAWLVDRRDVGGLRSPA